MTPTNDLGKLLSALNKASIGGVSDLITSIQIAQLALKHRENKNQRQRIVAFVGSPLDDSKDELVKLGKRLRKNNVLIDIVTFGDEGMANDDKINALVEAAGAGESHLVSVAPGPHLLSDIIQQSPILFDPERAGPSGGDMGGGGGGGADDFDPSSDPELAMALRMSLQEAQEREARERGTTSTTAAAAASAGDDKGNVGTEASELEVIPQDVAVPANPEAGHQAGFPASVTSPLRNANDSTIPEAPGDDEHMYDDEDEDDEDEELRRAMALSRGDDPDADVLMAEDEDDEDEDAAIARAIAMSLEDQKQQDNESK